MTAESQGAGWVNDKLAAELAERFAEFADTLPKSSKDAPFIYSHRRSLAKIAVAMLAAAPSASPAPEAVERVMLLIEDWLRAEVREAVRFPGAADPRPYKAKARAAIAALAQPAAGVEAERLRKTAKMMPLRCEHCGPGVGKSQIIDNLGCIRAIVHDSQPMAELIVSSVNARAALRPAGEPPAEGGG